MKKKFQSVNQLTYKWSLGGTKNIGILMSEYIFPDCILSVFTQRQTIIKPEYCKDFTYLCSMV